MALLAPPTPLEALAPPTPLEALAPPTPLEALAPPTPLEALAPPTPLEALAVAVVRIVLVSPVTWSDARPQPAEIASTPTNDAMCVRLILAP
jgi:hypothetical protein